MIKRKCCPELVQVYGFRLVKVLLDTPPGSPKNCPLAKGGSVRDQISLYMPVSFYMIKPRVCPSQDQSSPVQSSRPLGFGLVLSDQPAASRLEHCELACVNSTSNLGFPLSLKIVSQQEAELSGDENLKVEGVRGQTQTRSERGETDTENWALVWTGHMVRNKISLGNDFISSWEDDDREGFEES
ncbi:hypothetical protein DY000_02040521 [Brassica cretica]|uniref:Uncharacterized protein n=1 Tax=Brassica cretica TaxID=69181 RepID=A0ABQ7BLQ4_BRACR|nr:hypothetical protein DY000_02040521 [Brassica cretica]